jgi:hypothetical protein
MAVIVDHGDAVPLTGPREAPLHAAKARHGFADRVVGNAELVRHRDRRRRVRGVVPSGHRQHDVGNFMGRIGLAIAKHHLEL